MKLDEWSAGWDILRINQLLPLGCRWPKLQELHSALETMPRMSAYSGSYGGMGIYIGWRTYDWRWAYHHGVCLPNGPCGNRHGFHGDYDFDNIADAQLFPTYNIGELPESRTFLKIMASLGFRRAALGEFLVLPVLENHAALNN